MYCPKCGAEHNDDAIFCSKCGYKMQDSERDRIWDNLRSGEYREPIDDIPYYEGLDTGEKAMLCLGNMCISPILGIVLYFVWRNDKPQKADDACQVTIWSVVIGFLLTILFAVFNIY